MLNGKDHNRDADAIGKTTCLMGRTIDIIFIQ